VRRAVAKCRAIELTCPNCGLDIPAPCGSLYWTVEELGDAFGRSHKCSCGEESLLILPASVRAK
jgi:hypothetical protein